MGHPRPPIRLMSRSKRPVVSTQRRAGDAFGHHRCEYPKEERQWHNALKAIPSKRRTRVASMFPNAASCLRLVSALLTEFDEEWLTEKSI